MSILAALLFACSAPEYIDSPTRSAGSNTDTVEDTVEDTVDDTASVDADGDGYFADADDIALVDCDDNDASVTPLTERLVPEGWFLRGSRHVETASGDQYADAERPAARDIYLSAYCVDVYEVTNLEFVAFMEIEASLGRRNVTEDGEPLFDFWDDDDVYEERILDFGDAFGIQEGYDDHPVAEVWYHSAEAYCGAAGKRVPTEAEWEKAARGDDGRDLPWGDEVTTCERSNSTSENVMCVGDTEEVGLYPDSVSPYGAHDMVGNMGEWVSDWYSGSFYAEGPDEDPFADYDDAELAGFPEGESLARIARGGSFALGHPFDRTFARFLEPPEATSNGLGIRCVRDID